MHTCIDTDIEKPIQACIHTYAYVYREARGVGGVGGVRRVRGAGGVGGVHGVGGVGGVGGVRRVGGVGGVGGG